MRAGGIIFAALVPMALGCTVGAPTASGGSDLPNGAIAQVSGKAVGPDSLGIPGVQVVLRDVVITSRGDSVVSEFLTRSDSLGTFFFDSIPDGEYALFCSSADQKVAGIRQCVPINGNTALDPLVISPTVDFLGHVLLPPVVFDTEVAIFIPGTRVSVRTKPGSRRVVFALSDAPQGTYEIAFAFCGIANYLPVTVRADSAPGIVYIRDLEFAVLGIMADAAGSAHRTVLRNSYYVTPKIYPPGTEPTWYGETDLNGIHYLRPDATEWIADFTHNPQRYDTLLVGLLSSNPTGVVTLEASSWIAVLTGDVLVDIGPDKKCGIVAAKVESAPNLPTVYRIVDVRIDSIYCPRF